MWGGWRQGFDLEEIKVKQQDLNFRCGRNDWDEGICGEWHRGERKERWGREVRQKGV